MSDLLEQEQATYEELKEDLVSQGHTGKWVVIVGDRNIGLFDDPDAAYAAGIEAAGLDTPFLLKQIGSDDQASIPAFTLGILYADH